MINRGGSLHTLRAYDTGLQLFERARCRTISPMRAVIYFTRTQKRLREAFGLPHLNGILTLWNCLLVILRKINWFFEITANERKWWLETCLWSFTSVNWIKQQKTAWIKYYLHRVKTVDKTCHEFTKITNRICRISAKWWQRSRQKKGCELFCTVSLSLRVHLVK